MTSPESEHPSPHVGQELPGLLLGELGRGATRRVAAHLRTCARCRADLVDAAVAVGSIAASRRALTDAGEAPGRGGTQEPWESPPPCSQRGRLSGTAAGSPRTRR